MTTLNLSCRSKLFAPTVFFSLKVARQNDMTLQTGGLSRCKMAGAGFQSNATFRAQMFTLQRRGVPLA
jgi:hypothetical protein